MQIRLSTLARAALLATGALSAAAPASAADVQIAVNPSVEHQIWFGFGATHSTLVYGGTGDVLSASQRQRAVAALFEQVKLTTGQTPTTFETAQSSTLATFWNNQKNDNADPLSIDPTGFYTGLGDAFKTNVVDIAGGTFDLYPDVKITTRWANQWMQPIQASNYDAFLNECAEQVLVGVQYWKRTYGAAPRYAMLFNEPLSGNSELVGASAATVRDIVRRAGERLAANGFESVRFVVPAEETEDKSLSTATTVMSDAAAGKYVGAIAYHTYPYGSVYSYVPNILSTSGTGSPDPGRVTVRKQLKELGARYGVPVWMTEVSHAYLQSDNVEATDFRILRGRAIHIHDELVYADACAYFGMNSLWDRVSQANHFGSNGSEMSTTEQDTIVLIDQTLDSVTITSTGRAIGHYARFIGRGAVRVDATSSDPLVLVTAFKDPKQTGKLVLVLVNNAATPRAIDVNVSGGLNASVGGEQSTASAVWQKLPAIGASSSAFSITVPAESVTTLSSSESAIIGAGGGASTGGSSVGGNAGTSGRAGSSATGRGGAFAGGGGTSSNASASTGDQSGCTCRSGGTGSPHGYSGGPILLLAAWRLRSASRAIRRVRSPRGVLASSLL